MGLVSAAAIAWLWCVPDLTRHATNVAVRPRVQATKLAPLPAARPVYPFSIIRGGAYSATELKGALDRDDVAARHYRAFRQALVHTTAANFPAPVYISYRVGDEIYWTSRAVALPHGETLLTDGRNYARARCGNRISETPRTPVSDSEPALETLDRPRLPDSPPVAALDKWSEDRLLATPLLTAATVVPVGRAATPTDSGANEESDPASTWWDSGGAHALLALGAGPAPLAPISTPPGAGGTGPGIEPNPIPGLVFPPTSGYGYPSTLSTPEFPAAPAPPAPPALAAVQPAAPEVWPPIPQFPTVPNVPGAPQIPGSPNPPGTPNTPGMPATPGTPTEPTVPGTPSTPEPPGEPGNPLQPVSEPALLLPLAVAFAALAARRVKSSLL